tara:strand:+ start:92 stop:433 length:342 start_codon:yes stop_codon:yes gene_type:complete
MGLPEIPHDPWFNEKHNPLDDMPIATNDRFDMYGSSEADDAYNPRPEEEIADLYASRHESSPDFEQSAEEVVTIHEKMYRMATARYNPFHIGASENYHADIDYVGGSENVQSN